MSDDLYLTHTPDTTRDVERRLIAGLRAMTPRDKLRIADDLGRMAELAALAGLRARHPGCSEDELRLRLAALKYDRHVVVSCLGWDPVENER